MLTIELVTAPVVCAWCKRPIGRYAPTDTEAHSDGICPECARKLERGTH